MSVPLPADCPTMIRTGRDGYACARAVPLTAGGAGNTGRQMQELAAGTFHCGPPKEFACPSNSRVQALTTQRIRMFITSFGYQHTKRQSTILFFLFARTIA